MARASLHGQGLVDQELQRLIMLSATYQQRARTTHSARKVDPENTLLWRMNRQRLDFEATRDSLLAVTGQLDLGDGRASRRHHH